MYQLENVPLFEAIYGPGLISLGGYQAVKRMFHGIQLQDKSLLDIGSGIGGMAYFLAQHYHSKVTGLEIHPWMAEYARKNAPPKIQNRVHFISYSGSESIPLATETMDIVYSKGVLTNIEDKKPLLKDLKRILKPSGSLVFIDWLSTQKPTNEILPLGDMSRKETAESYKDLLVEANFLTIDFIDVTAEYLDYVNELGVLLASTQHKITYGQIIPDALRDQLIKANDHLRAQIEEGRQKSFRILAS